LDDAADGVDVGHERLESDEGGWEEEKCQATIAGSPLNRTYTIPYTLQAQLSSCPHLKQLASGRASVVNVAVRASWCEMRQLSWEDGEDVRQRQ
jgi:hypothetical protein